MKRSRSMRSRWSGEPGGSDGTGRATKRPAHLGRAAGSIAARFDPAVRRNYNVIMKASIIQIGNSRGVRIPKAFLDQAGLCDDVEIEVRGSEIVVRTVRRAREGWREAFRRLAKNGDDALLDAEAPALSSWDEQEWEW